MKKAVKAGDKIDYKSAIAQLTIDLEAAGNNELSWTVLPLVKDQRADMTGNQRYTA